MSPPIINLPTNYGFPVCLSGIRPPLPLSKEMADHERRRKAIKKLKLKGRYDDLHEDQRVRSETSNERRIYEEIIRGEDGHTHDHEVHDHVSCAFNACTCTAKAA